MKYYSTNDHQHFVDFEEAVFKSLPPDNGLYFPESIPTFSKEWVRSLPSRSLLESATEVAKHFVGDEIQDDELAQIVEDCLDLELPVSNVSKGIDVLELYHGPTWAFKDVGARFLARTMGYFSKRRGKEITILVATSGDTGGAVASGFHKVDGTNVIILYPKGKVSDVQKKQLTTLGHNIKAYEVDGVFDDCQSIVKKAFLDPELNKRFNLSSANSINVARFLPQSFYYFELYRQRPVDNLVVAVPSGNYGNLTAGLFAKRMGLPINHFIAASNVNKVVPDYLKTGVFLPVDSVQTYSNAMDVGNPSNFVRMQELYGNSYEDMKKDISGFWLDDEQTLATMKSCYNENDYVLDPHGAIGYAACKRYLNEKPEANTVFLETAHPVKFQPVLDKAFDGTINYPEKIATLMDQESEFDSIAADFEEFKKRLLDS